MGYLNIIMKIQDDELITSWLEVLAINNNFTVREFITDFKKEKRDIYNIGLRKDYLRNIEHFCSHYSSNRFPNEHDIMWKHTGYYACMPFRKKNINALISESMLRYYGRSEKRKIFSDQFLNEEIVHYMVCPECMKEDIEKCARPYVHVWHNFPGVTCCQKHGCNLVNLDSNKYEVVEAKEDDMKIARFMYQSYLNPCYGYLERTLPVIENLGLNLPNTKKHEIGQLISIVSTLFSYDEFKQMLEQLEKQKDKLQTLIIKRMCKTCGKEYYISQDAEEMGFGCYECDKTKDYFQIVKRFVEHVNNNEFRLEKILAQDRILVMHKPCGRSASKNFIKFIVDGIPCHKCNESHFGETTTAVDGQKITIVEYRNYNDVDIQFEDGVIAKHRRYSSFKNGIVRYPLDQVRIGETAVANNGMKMTIIDYRNTMDVDIQFEDGIIVKNITYFAFKQGKIRHPSCSVFRTNRLGKTVMANNGMKMTIVEYRGVDDIDVQLEDGTTVKHRSYSDFKQGKIRYPKEKHNRCGEEMITNSGHKITIIEYRSSADLDVKFEDGAIVKNRRYDEFIKGNIRHPSIASIKTHRVGETNMSTNGGKMTILKYRTNSDIDVQFEDGAVAEHKSYQAFLDGQIKHPEVPLALMDRIGETAIANNGQKMTIIGYRTSRNVDIQFEDGTVVTGRRYDRFVRGSIENPNCKFRPNKKRE